jgi:Subtilase family
MPDGVPERPGEAPLPHLIVPWRASDQSYRGRSGGSPKKVREIANRSGHAARLSSELATAEEAAREQQAEVADDVRPDGFALAVDGWSDEPGYALALASLDAHGAKLLSVQPASGQSAERAVLWLPYAAVQRFFQRIEQYATEETRTGKPKNLPFIANIAELRLAILRDLWQEEDHFPDPDEPRWWELWLARFTREHQPDSVLKAVAAQREWPVVSETLAFPDNVITLVRTSATELGTILNTSAIPSELHKARVASEILGLDQYFQRDLIAELATRIDAAPARSAAVCVLDTGLMSAHPLLRASIDTTDSALDGVDPADRAGHGTQMAGLTLFGDLDHDLKSSERVALRHRLESIKVILGSHDVKTDPVMYGTISATAAARVEVAEPGRRRAFSMAVTADDSHGSDGRPTSWSASLDALAFGTDIRPTDTGIELLTRPDPQAARLFVVSAGNVPWEQHGLADHLTVSDTSSIQSPAQAWNVLTVGACTELTQPPSDPAFRGWTTVAAAGELAPFSRTSMLFRRSWPIKPDVVLEGGNLIVSPSGTPNAHHDVSILTTSNSEFKLLTTANATSAATAQAARLAAIAMETYPNLWPEAVRALLVHSAEWTPAMRSRIGAARTQDERLRLIRRYGWGVPTHQRVLASASNSVTLIVQDEFLPFEHGTSGISMRALRLHRLPWPEEQLRDLFSAKVRLRVTLSYFVEPNPCQPRLAGKVPVRLSWSPLRRQASGGEPGRVPASHPQRGRAGGDPFDTAGQQPRRPLGSRQPDAQLRLAARRHLDRNRRRARRQRIHRRHPGRRLVEGQQPPRPRRAAGSLRAACFAANGSRGSRHLHPDRDADRCSCGDRHLTLISGWMRAFPHPDESMTSLSSHEQAIMTI